MKIARLLIANRGEIAIRIADACRELAIESVAIYSEADRDAAHVAAADRAVCVGPAPATESYLAIDRIIAAARETGADAVHPGYGFLSENHRFATACEAAGLIFVGPPASVMRAMGSKIGTRALMEAAGVPVVPGATPETQSDAGIRAAIDRVGLPVLIKAASGGGGKGMRRATHGDDLDALIQSARREAESAFGSGALYVERLVEHPHHVEVQILGDAHGTIVHLFERECSTQRRHQKVLEESPSPNLTPGLRQRMTAAAIAAARAVGYRNAGTVEFLVDLAQGPRDDACFYFLEINMRLQVEHGVTESVTGVDLVHAQLRVAAGDRVPWSQGALASRGHAIEARIYAEDPAQSFLPQAGRLLLYREPRRPGIRIDSGVREGDSVPVHYDPLLAKVIATAETRRAATIRLVHALRGFPILGVRTNIPFLIRVLEHDAFRTGAIDTTWLDGPGRELLADPDGPPPEVVAAVFSDAAAASRRTSQTAPEADDVRLQPDATSDPWVALKGWRG